MSEGGGGYRIQLRKGGKKERKKPFLRVSFSMFLVSSSSQIKSKVLVGSQYYLSLLLSLSSLTGTFYLPAVPRFTIAHSHEQVNRTLTSLNMNGNVIGDEGARPIAEALKVCSHLTLFFVFFVLFVFVVAVALTFTVFLIPLLHHTHTRFAHTTKQINRTLTALDLSDNNEIGVDIAKAFAEVLKVCLPCLLVCVLVKRSAA